MFSLQVMFKHLGNHIAYKRQDKCHVKAVRAKREDPAVPKQQRLYEQRDRHGNTCRVRAAERSDKRSSHRMAGRTAGKRDIEHHPKK